MSLIEFSTRFKYKPWAVGIMKSCSGLQHQNIFDQLIECIEVRLFIFHFTCTHHRLSEIAKATSASAFQTPGADFTVSASTEYRQSNVRSLYIISRLPPLTVNIAPRVLGHSDLNPSSQKKASSNTASTTEQTDKERKMPTRTAVLTDTTNIDSSSAYLTSSLTSLSRSRSSNNLIVRTYKQATQLYLTRRFREAWDVLGTIVRGSEGQEGEENNSGNFNNTNDDEGNLSPAPVAQSSRGTRTKVWVFYLSLIHAVVELGAEEGGREFGGTEKWRSIAKKAREGTVWGEIVARGYGGQEGEVDAEVVVNLATLLLGHMVDQRANQTRLETFLASSEDVSAGNLMGGYDGVSTPMSSHSVSPKALQARVKVLELYALHVLPEVGEWEYAREFVEGCGSLDEERKEGFLAALDGLKEEREGLKRREVELQEQREREVQEEKMRREQEDERRRVEEERVKIEREKQQKKERDAAAAAAALSNSVNANNNTLSNSNNANGNSNSNNSRPNQPSRSARKPTPSSSQNSPASNATLLTRLTSIIHHLRHNLLGGPSLLSARLLMFIFAFILLASRRDMRVRLRRALAEGWDKVRRTVGMGVKVSYV
jgi:hypothetical protein